MELSEIETITLHSYYAPLNRYGVNRLISALEPLVSKGLRAVLVFGVPSQSNKVSSFVEPLANERRNLL